MKHNTKYRPIPKGKYFKRLTLYDKIKLALATGELKEYDKILDPLERCQDKAELRDIITHLMRDYLFIAKREKYLPTPKDKFNLLFTKYHTHE